MISKLLREVRHTKMSTRTDKVMTRYETAKETDYYAHNTENIMTKVLPLDTSGIDPKVLAEIKLDVKRIMKLPFDEMVLEMGLESEVKKLEIEMRLWHENHPDKTE